VRLVCLVLVIGLCACKRETPPPEHPPYAAEHALSIALTLAAVRDHPDKLSDRQLVERYRVETMFGLMVMRRWTIGPTPSPTTITADEARYVLGIEPPPAGQAIELGTRSPHVPLLVATLLDPDAKIAQRTRALTGVDEPELHALLRDNLKIDLAKRTINGQPWTTGRDAQTSWMPRVVEQVKDFYMELALRDAQRLEPSARIGQELWLRSDIPIWIPEHPLHTPATTHLTVDSNDFNRMRHLATPKPPVAGITTPVFAMYPEGYDVLFTNVPRDDAMARWQALDAAQGVRPILFYGDGHDVLDARLTWSAGEPLMDQAASHPMQTPDAALGAVDSVDVAALLAHNPSYPDYKVPHGPWPKTVPAPRRAFAVVTPIDDEPPTATRTLILVPTDAAWKAIAYVPGFVNAGEATPSLAQVAAVSRRWEQRYGARLAAIGPATLEYFLSRRLDKREALALATELLELAPNADDDVVEAVAARLLNDVSFTAWWD
jgi:hypothetical protein